MRYCCTKESQLGKESFDEFRKMIQGYLIHSICNVITKLKFQTCPFLKNKPCLLFSVNI